MPAICYDGLVARAARVLVHVETAPAEGVPALAIRLAENEQEIDRWPLDSLVTRPARPNELRIGSRARPPGARLIVVGEALVTELENLVPHLHRAAAKRRWRERRVLFGGVVALAGAIAAFVFALPYAVGPIAAVIPPAWEISTGEVAERQLAAMFRAGESFSTCGSGEQRDVAQAALDRFGTDAINGVDTPFTPHILVVRSPLENAFTLPGGRILLFSGLIDRMEDRDELAGVLAHEIGHMVARDGMKSVISATATGFFTGFVTGDLTGTSVAGGLGAAILRARFSQSAEADADRYAIAAAERLGFDTSGLASLLIRVDTASTAFSLLETHPPTPERSLLLMRSAGHEGPTPIFSSEEWQAIKQLCGD
jgi:Zn-dependent protease with chaperone function